MSTPRFTTWTRTIYTQKTNKQKNPQYITYKHHIASPPPTHTHTGAQNDCSGEEGGGGDKKKTEFEIICFRYCLQSWHFNAFWRQGGTECDGCEKAENSIAEYRKRERALVARSRTEGGGRWWWWRNQKKKKKKKKNQCKTEDVNCVVLSRPQGWTCLQETRDRNKSPVTRLSDAGDRPGNALGVSVTFPR